MCHGTTDWVRALPMTLLGLRSCYKEDIKASAAEMVYGTTLRIPGEFISDDDTDVNPNNFVESFREHMRKLRPTPTAHHIRAKIFVHKDLYSCTHVFLRDDTVRKPLQRPYTGPHEVIKRITDRLFTLKVNGRETNVNTERLKPAYLPITEITN